MIASQQPPSSGTCSVVSLNVVVIHPGRAFLQLNGVSVVTFTQPRVVGADTLPANNGVGPRAPKRRYGSSGLNGGAPSVPVITRIMEPFITGAARAVIQPAAGSIMIAISGIV